MASHAVGFVISGNILFWVVDAVESPPPAKTPIGVIGERSRVLVLDHHEPLFELAVPMDVSRSHFTLLTLPDFLYESRTRRPLAGISECRHCPRLGIDTVHFARTTIFAFDIPRAEMDPLKSIVLGQMNRAVFINVFPKKGSRLTRT